MTSLLQNALLQERERIKVLSRIVEDIRSAVAMFDGIQGRTDLYPDPSPRVGKLLKELEERREGVLQPGEYRKDAYTKLERMSRREAAVHGISPFNEVLHERPRENEDGTS